MDVLRTMFDADPGGTGDRPRAPAIAVVTRAVTKALPVLVTVEPASTAKSSAARGLGKRAGRENALAAARDGGHRVAAMTFTTA